MTKRKPFYKLPKFWAVMTGFGLAGTYALNGDWRAAVSTVISVIVGP